MGTTGMSVSDHETPLTSTLNSSFWEEREPMVASVLARMESVETWTHDATPGAADKLQRLFAAIDEGTRNGQIPPDKPLLDFVGYIRSGKALRLIQWIDVMTPGYVDKLVSSALTLADTPDVADETSVKSATLFVERLLHLERMYILHRVFSPESLRDVLETLDEVIQDETQF